MLEENVRAWERECGSEQHGVYTRDQESPWRGRMNVSPVAALLDHAACLEVHTPSRATLTALKAEEAPAEVHASSQGDEER
jgi:hypothetical protein